MGRKILARYSLSNPGSLLLSSLLEQTKLVKKLRISFRTTTNTSSNYYLSTSNSCRGDDEDEILVYQLEVKTAWKLHSESRSELGVATEH